MLDTSRDVQILRYKDGEKGVDVVSTLYTHLDGNDRPQSVLVNRGWMPWDMRTFNYDKTGSHTQVTGVLYRGDSRTKYSKPNVPMRNVYRAAYPEELVLAH